MNVFKSNGSNFMKEILFNSTKINSNEIDYKVLRL